MPVALPGFLGIELYLKDESSPSTGSLKHRLLRSLFLHALCKGWLHEGGAVVEASSGSTAVGEAYFAPLLALPFIAVTPGCSRSLGGRSWQPLNSKVAPVIWRATRRPLTPKAADLPMSGAAIS